MELTVRNAIAKTILQPTILTTIDTVMRYLGVALIGLIIENVNELMRLQRKFHEVQAASAGPGDDAPAGEALDIKDFPFKKAIAQRNLYMSTFCLIVALSLTRLVDLVSKEIKYRRIIQELNGGKAIDEDGDTIVEGRKAQ